MAENMGGDQEFVSDEVQNIMKEVNNFSIVFLMVFKAISACFGLKDSPDGTNLKYSKLKVRGYCDNIIEACIRNLARL